MLRVVFVGLALGVLGVADLGVARADGTYFEGFKRRDGSYVMPYTRPTASSILQYSFPIAEYMNRYPRKEAAKVSSSGNSPAPDSSPSSYTLIRGATDDAPAAPNSVGTASGGATRSLPGD